MRTFLSARSFVLIALVLGFAEGPALAQGTAEQQEACTPDALKFCTATIPDIGKTTACMKGHFAQLSPRCRAAFADATGNPAKKPSASAPAKVAKPAAAAPKIRVAKRAAEARETEAEPRHAPARVPRTSLETSVPPAARREAAPAITASAAPRSRLPGLDSYEARIHLACHDGLIDPFTCRNTIQALDLLQ